MPKDNDFTLIFDKFFQGFAPLAFVNSLTEIGGAGSAGSMQNVDVLTDVITQGPALANLTNGTQAGAVTELLNFIMDKAISADVTYGMGTSKLFQISSAAVANAGIWPHAITNCVDGQSIQYIKGTLLYFFNKASVGEIGAYDLASTFNDTWGSNRKKIDQIILTGTEGTATITLAGGLTKTVTFNTNLTTTASDFVTANAAAYLAQGIVLTSSVYKLIFTAQTAGVTFTTPEIANATADLTGSVSHIVVPELEKAIHPSDKKEDMVVFGNGRYAGVYVATGNSLNSRMLDFGNDCIVADVLYSAGFWYLAVNSGISGTNRTEGQIYLWQASGTTSQLEDETGVGMQRIGFLYRLNGRIYVAYQDLSSTGFIIGIINGSSIEPLGRFTGTLPTFNQKTLFKNTILFLSSGSVFSAGALVGDLPFQLSQIADGGYATCGAISAPFGTPIIASTDGGSNFRLAKFSGFDTACNWKSIIVPLVGSGTKGVIDKVTVLTKTLTANAKCDVIVEADQATLMSNTLSATGTGKRKHVMSNVGLGPIEDLRIYLNWENGNTTNDCPVRRVIVKGHWTED